MINRRELLELLAGALGVSATWGIPLQPQDVVAPVPPLEPPPPVDVATRYTYEFQGNVYAVTKLEVNTVEAFAGAPLDYYTPRRLDGWISLLDSEKLTLFNENNVIWGKLRKDGKVIKRVRGFVQAYSYTPADTSGPSVELCVLDYFDPEPSTIYVQPDKPDIS